jgi:16S rRNA (cytidine1402-2'-O)-methyltransferase
VSGRAEGSDDAIDPELLDEFAGWPEPEAPGAPEGRGAPDEAEEPEGINADRGVLVLVGTPIGNLGDLSPRATDLLATADLVYCEDTRHSRKLLTHAGITGVSMRSLHDHNEMDRIGEVVREVERGRTVALVSDAGMPGISDPGTRLVAEVVAAGLTVSVVPGPSAVLAALVASGLPTDRFCFEGFLPRSGKERRARMAMVSEEFRTVVLFEAPGRVAATLNELLAVCGGDRRVSVARELTKVHEEIWRGTLSDAVAWSSSAPVRGEVVLVLGGAPECDVPEIPDVTLEAAVVARVAAGERTRGAVDAVAAEFAVARRRVYDLALAARNRSGGASGPPPDNPSD